MGDTAVSGADTPLYKPRTPSFRKVFDNIPTTDALARAVPPVCIRTLTRSSGCPTRTQHAPPTPPDMKDFRADSDFGAAFLVSSTFGEAGLVGLVSSFVVIVVGLISEEGDVVVDILLIIRWKRKGYDII